MIPASLFSSRVVRLLPVAATFMPTLQTNGSGRFYAGQVVYLRAVVREFCDDVDGTRCAMIECVRKDGTPDPDAFIRLHMVTEDQLVAAKIVAGEMK